MHGENWNLYFQWQCVVDALLFLNHYWHGENNTLQTCAYYMYNTNPFVIRTSRWGVKHCNKHYVSINKLVWFINVLIITLWNYLNSLGPIFFRIIGFWVVISLKRRVSVSVRKIIFLICFCQGCKLKGEGLPTTM